MKAYVTAIWEETHALKWGHENINDEKVPNVKVFNSLDNVAYQRQSFHLYYGVFKANDRKKDMRVKSIEPLKQLVK